MSPLYGFPLSAPLKETKSVPWLPVRFGPAPRRRSWIMKTRLEVVTNVVVILVALVIGSIYLKDRFATPTPK
jgi:hypothetical protein